MITKAQVKHISSLVDKKNRIEFDEFIVEGEKIVDELIKSPIEIKEIYALSSWILQHQFIQNTNILVHEVNQSELDRISLQKSPNQVLAIAKMPNTIQEYEFTKSLLLDNLQDPGNMGSILRIADWFGISHVFCHGACVDVYSPKVVQSSMGSVFRVQVQTIDAIDFLQKNKDIPSFAAILQGEDIRKIEKVEKAIIVIGNESKGISEDIIKLCTQKVTIPSDGNAESLNAAVATGIICYALL